MPPHIIVLPLSVSVVASLCSLFWSCAALHQNVPVCSFLFVIVLLPSVAADSSSVTRLNTPSSPPHRSSQSTQGGHTSRGGVASTVPPEVQGRRKKEHVCQCKGYPYSFVAGRCRTFFFFLEGCSCYTCLPHQHRSRAYRKRKYTHTHTDTYIYTHRTFCPWTRASHTSQWLQLLLKTDEGREGRGCVVVDLLFFFKLL
jgi:hypothetical protein